MKKYYIILTVGFFSFFACEKAEIEINNTEEVIAPKFEQGVDTGVMPAEYFRVEVDEDFFETESAANIKGTTYPSDHSGVINFDFFMMFEDPNLEVGFSKEFNFKVCFFDGPGTYYTGTPYTASWAYFFSDYHYWENHHEFGHEPGEVIVTKATKNYVEGTFSYEAYNRELDSTAIVKGEFGLVLESREDYNSP